MNSMMELVTNRNAKKRIREQAQRMFIFIAILNRNEKRWEMVSSVVEGVAKHKMREKARKEWKDGSGLASDSWGSLGPQFYDSSCFTSPVTSLEHYDPSCINIFNLLYGITSRKASKAQFTPELQTRCRPGAHGSVEQL